MKPARAVSRRRRLLMCVATDNTWRWTGTRWLGKCLHCNRKITLTETGQSEGSATLEHIVPRTHGGGDDLANLGVACGRCNHQKGRKVDVLHASDERLIRVVETLRQRKQARWRPPIERLAFYFEDDGVNSAEPT